MRLMLWIGLLTAATPLWAQGYGVYDQGAASTASQGAFVARADDGSAVFANPAGLSFLRFDELAINTKGFFSKSFYSNIGQSTWGSNESITGAPEILYNYRAKNSRWGFGIGTATTQEHVMAWKHADFPGRFKTSRHEFFSQELAAGFGVRFTPSFGVGLSVRYAYAEMTQASVLPRPLPGTSLFYETEQSMDLDGGAIGFTLGARYRPNARWSFGASYQSAIDIDLDGNRTYSLFSRQDDVRAQAALAAWQGAPVSSEITLPERFQVGFVTRVTVRTRLEMDASFESWSDVDTQVFNTADGGGAAETIVLPRTWDDTTSYRVAGIFQQRKALRWTAGLGSAQGAVPGSTIEPGVLNHNVFMYSFGVSYVWRERYVLDASWLYIQSRDREVSGQEFEINRSVEDYLLNNGQDGLYESQKTHLTLGLRIRLGVPMAERKFRLKRRI